MTTLFGNVYSEWTRLTRAQGCTQTGHSTKDTFPCSQASTPRTQSTIPFGINPTQDASINLKYNQCGNSMAVIGQLKATTSNMQSVFIGLKWTSPVGLGRKREEEKRKKQGRAQSIVHTRRPVGVVPRCQERTRARALCAKRNAQKCGAQRAMHGTNK